MIVKKIWFTLSMHFSVRGGFADCKIVKQNAFVLLNCFRNFADL